MAAGSDSTPNLPILVVIPVYGDEAITRNCLQSVARSDLPATTSVLLINDCTPDPGVEALCSEYAAEDGFELVANEENLGFVASANRGLQHDTQADVVLLNSDTVVSGDWLQRLQACADREPKTGTVTPFSNNGTICSYPVTMADSPLPEGWTAHELDNVFKAENAGNSAVIPTAVGFCMYIRRACIEMIGLFDNENFGQGYGEECDFSLRATAAGWQNRVAADTFIFHEGGASFAEETEQRKEQADQVIDRLHPDYNRIVRQFIQEDPLHQFRQAVDMARLRARPDQAELLLAERQRYIELIRDISDELLTDLLGEQAQREAELEQRLQLESHLEEIRAQFSRTDKALTAAQALVESLNGDIARLNEAIEERDDVLRGKYLEVDQLSAKIHAMEQSRSWRYTAWLRRMGAQEDS